MKLFFLATAFIFVNSISFADDMKAGLYQVDIKFVYPPSPIYASAPKSSSSKQCTQKGKVKNLLTKQLSEQPGCKVLKSDTVGNKSTWKLSCAGGMSTAEGYIDFKQDSFSGETKSTAKIPRSKDIVIITKYSGKRVGDCLESKIK